MILIDRLYLLFKHCFQQFHQTKFLAYCLAIFFCSLFTYGALVYLKRHGHKILAGSLNRYLFINADKSDSNAIQMGGVPFALISMLSIGLLFIWFPYLIGSHQATVLLFATCSWIGILVYGYVDDLFEIRPIVKLASQLIINSVFCLGVSNVIFHENSAIAFVVLLFLSTALVNGANLIDGLDTLSYKVSSVIYLAYIVLAAPVMNLPALFIAMACFCIMSGFYFYNKEPSKIHLGEVGGSCLGFSYIVLGVLTFDSYKQINQPVLAALTKAIFPCVLPLVELSVSFGRRILNGKSPFKGDKLHIHHILHEVKGFSASNSSTIIAFVYLVFITLSLIVMDPYSSFLAFGVLIFLTVFWYLYLGWRLWFSGEIKINILENILVKKEVRIISSSSLSDFRLIINKSEEPKE